MQRVILILFLIFLIFGIILNSPVILAQETPTNPGVTPDSFLWGLDKALEQISLLLATSPNAKATKGLKIASERLAEIKVMIEENKLEAAEKARENHGELLATVQQNIEELEEDDSIEEIKEVIKIEKELKENEQEIKQISGELKIKIKIKGEITEQQQALIDSILASLEGQTGEVEIEIENKKDGTKIKIKQETGMSDDEVEDEIEKLEIEGGVAGIEVEAEIVGDQAEVKIEREFSTKTTDKAAIIQEIIDNFALDNETADAALEIEEEDEDEELEEKFKVEVEIEEGVAEVEVELKFILNSTDRKSILDAVVAKSKLTKEQIEAIIKFEDEDEEEDEEIEVEVEIEKGMAMVKVEVGKEKFEFTLETTDRNEIISEIVKRTGLTEEEINAVIEFETEAEEENEENETEEELEEGAENETEED